MVTIPLLVPGISLAGLLWLSSKRLIEGRLEILGAVLFLLLVLGCSIFAGWLSTADADPTWRRYFWIESAVLATMMQIVIAPVLAGILMIFFL